MVENFQSYIFASHANLTWRERDSKRTKTKISDYKEINQSKRNLISMVQISSLVKMVPTASLSLCLHGRYIHILYWQQPSLFEFIWPQVTIGGRVVERFFICHQTLLGLEKTISFGWQGRWFHFFFFHFSQVKNSIWWREQKELLHFSS